MYGKDGNRFENSVDLLKLFGGYKNDVVYVFNDVEGELYCGCSQLLCKTFRN
jgi:nitrogenase subunit NifH